MSTIATSSRSLLSRVWGKLKSLGVTCTCYVLQDVYNSTTANYESSPSSTKEFIAIRDDYSSYERVSGIETNDFLLIFPVSSLDYPLKVDMLVVVNGVSCKVVSFLLDPTGFFYEVQVRR